jgi:predicted PolB exonuclease-like 3'-5' exonuclease
MNRSFLVLDIETVPEMSGNDTSGGWTADDKGFPPLHVHRPVVVGVLWLDHELRFRRLGIVGEGKDEREMLEDLSAFVTRHQPELVTYNGRGFDLPVLALRSLKHGVPMPWHYEGKVGHVDLCAALSNHGAARSTSLDAVARLIGLPGKIGVDGSQVEALWRAGRADQVKRYCLADVAQTALLFLRFRLLAGTLEAGRYRQAARELMEALRADGRVAELVSAIDGDRLLAAA